MKTITSPRVYIASLSDYNSGNLLGCWCDFTENIHKQVQTMLTQSKEEVAEEWAIHDHEGFPAGLVQEYSDLDELADWAEFIEETGDNDLIQAAMACSDSHSLGDVKSTMENLEGQFDRNGLADWAQENCASCDDGSLAKLPNCIRCHIDWESVGRDMLHDYQYSEVGGTTYLFSN